MVKGNNYQEAEFNNASYKNNTRKKLKSREKEGKIFFFLVYFQKQAGLLSFFKNPP
jgi:hypothetical protein